LLPKVTEAETAVHGRTTESTGTLAGSESRRARLGALLASSGVETPPEIAALEVTSVEYDSRRVEPGALFVAVRGFVTDGHAHIPDAVRRGAVAALVEEKTGAAGVAEVVVPNTRIALGHVAHEFFDRPSERLKTHGITGTNGKTTTSYLIDSILRATGATTGVVGTLGYRAGGESAPGDRTSPESSDLAGMMASMLEAGVTAVAMEVSSHALVLGRVVGTKFDTATLTNLSRDHLDFHGTVAEYGAAKKKLFELLEGDGWKPGATAVLNCEDELGREIIASLRGSQRVRTLTYGVSKGDVHASAVSASPSGTGARFETPSGAFPVRLRLIAGFNVANALAATAVAVSQGVAPEAIQAGLANVERIDGRLELVDVGQEFTVVVDYAHTPDALEKVLLALRALRPGRVITVFGCGGDRDRGKRPIMGEIALRNSDIVIVTSDNPRSEDPAAIIADILAGRRDEPGARPFEVIENRREAIVRAVGLAAPGDVVLIAGKGHEDYQIVGTERLHFDDREEARAAIEKLRRGR
jgi:UDP-N-acetylmuramoyl-L-alanyl-D-glutamate--2,6-diaminopimelate ligase